MQGAIDGYVSEMTKDCKLASTSFVTYKGHDALDFSGYCSNDKYYFNGKILVRDDLASVRIYLIESAAYTEDIQNYNKFLDSFSISE